MKYSGTKSIGVRTPIIKKGDDLASIVVESVLKATKEFEMPLEDRDVVCVTEAVLGISQGNYATIDDIASDVKSKFGDATVGLIFPILSRNRFSQLLRSISRGCKELVIMLSYPSDEVGNHLISEEEVLDAGVNPYTDVLSEEEFRSHFPVTVHQFTGVDYIEFYKNICECPVKIVFGNNPTAILNFTKNVIVGSIHRRKMDKRLLKAAGAEKVYGLDDILTAPINGSGYNDKYGILGSNFTNEKSVKLFPLHAQEFVEDVAARFLNLTGKHVEVMVYGDGAFKDPQGQIWELADPVVSPGYTKGLVGTPNELKLKFISDNKLGELRGEELNAAMKKLILEKDADLKGTDETLGTTPRQYTDLLGSLADLTSGSGDKGTPVVLIKDYFKNYANE